MDSVRHSLSSYCTVANFINSLHTISQDLSVIGLPDIASYEKNNPEPVVVSLINTVWTLLQHRQHFIDRNRELQQEIVILTSDSSYSKEKVKQLEESLAKCQESLKKERKKATLEQEDKSEELKNTKCLRQEILELKQQLKSREQQFQHELKRHQIEISDLRTHLRKVLSKEEGKLSKDPIDNSTRSKPKEEINFYMKEAIYKKSISRLENNVQTLVKENLELRKVLDTVNSDLAYLMKETIQETTEDDVT